MLEIDCRGKACPEPVVMTKDALAPLKEGLLTVIVDNPSSSANVERFAQSQGCSVEVEKRESEFYLRIQKGKGGEDQTLTRKDTKVEKVVVYLSSHLLGVGDETLGSFLMKAFLKTLLDLEKRPDRLILINSGVQLASEDSKALETLRVLSEKGVEIVSCGTCIDFYGLKDKIKVGAISNMYDIVQSLLGADRVIRP
ncbi:MAG: sulfurtransferase-like selenium metabolism protein YedF [Thermodesulfobacteriota bacterium]